VIISAQITLDVLIECIISLLGNIPQAECRAADDCRRSPKESKHHQLNRTNGFPTSTNISEKLDFFIS
jgi:hypothetical protein